MQKQKGFTIIELIVVIAIIAVLAAIVLVNVTQYINKGKDAAAEGNLATLLTDGAKYFDTNSNYDNFMATSGTNVNPDFVNVVAALTNAGYTIPTTTCDQTDNCSGGSSTTPDTKWCALITLKSTTNTYCVDSSGNKVNKASGTCTAGVCN
jgi:type IV pilus assembly protein PilA